MHQNLKNHKERAFLLFYRVYIYRNNTKKPWNKLSLTEREDKKFKWDAIKLFVMSNGVITSEDVINHLNTCPEAFEYTTGTNKDAFKDVMTNEKWSNTSIWIDIYEPFPLTEYDSKLLINALGLRMCHFVNTKNKK
jgi:hypothetical protein